MAAIGGIVMFLVLAVLSAIWNGYAVSVLWSWFVVPTFGLPALTIPQAIGIALIVSFLAHQWIEDDNQSNLTWVGQLAKGAIIAFLRPAFALLVGWIVTFWL